MGLYRFCWECMQWLKSYNHDPNRLCKQLWISFFYQWYNKYTPLMVGHSKISIKCYLSWFLPLHLHNANTFRQFRVILFFFYFSSARWSSLWPFLASCFIFGSRHFFLSFLYLSFFYFSRDCLLSPSSFSLNQFLSHFFLSLQQNKKKN